MLLPERDEDPSDIYGFNATMDVQPGDILGLFEPDNSWLRLYYTDQYGPVNYYMDTGSAVTPPTGDFDISGADGMMNDMPLVTVEFCKYSVLGVCKRVPANRQLYACMCVCMSMAVKE